MTPAAPHPRHVLAAFAVALVLSGAAGRGEAAPITFNTALPVATGEFVFRELFVYDKATDDPSAADRDLEGLAATSVLGYGATGRLALFGVVPYVDRRIELTESGERRARSDRGIGDVRLFGRYTVFRDDVPGRTFRIAPFAGLELPTGDDEDRDAFGRKPAPVRPGSGSVDPFGGVVATYQTLAFQVDAQASYQANTEANGFEFGDVARLDGSLQYRLWPRELGGGVPAFLYGVLEANLIHQGRNESAGIEDPNSGGTSLFLVPGLQYVTKRWIVEAGVQVPLVQDLNGTALEKDFVVLAGFRINFGL